MSTIKFANSLPLIFAVLEVLSVVGEDSSIFSQLEEITAITNDTTGPYWNNKHPDHAKMVQQVYTIREMAQPKED